MFSKFLELPEENIFPFRYDLFNGYNICIGLQNDPSRFSFGNVRADQLRGTKLILRLPCIQDVQ